jgi:hypothetical protein
MNFPVEELKQGLKARCKCWSNTEHYIYYVPEATYSTVTDNAKKQHGDKVNIGHYLSLSVEKGKTLVWTPRTIDVLSDQWEIID